MIADLVKQQRKNESLPNGVWILGSGSFAQFLYRELSNKGCKVQGYADDYRSGSVEGIQIEKIASVPKQSTVVIGILNPYVSILDRVSALKELGITDIWSPPRIAAALGSREVIFESFWLTTDPSFNEEVDKHHEFVLSNLSDDYSRDLFIRTLNYRLTGDIEHLNPPEPVIDQYFPRDLEFISNCINYVDIGSFDGDTVRSLIHHGVKPNLYLGFEPDLENYSKLSSEVEKSGFNYLIFPLGTSSSSKQFSFISNGSSSAVISEDGESRIQCVALDELLGIPVTHIKMDIEGAELETLKGLKNTISRYAPNLAVSVYHKPDDMWRLMQEIIEYKSSYRFYLRCYGEQTFETVLYAIHK